MKEFAVVHFTRGNEVEVVPSSWVSEDKLKCLYPKYKPPNFEALRATPGSIPPSSWGKYKIKFVKSYADLSSAEAKAARYIVTSDIESSSNEDGQSIPRANISDLKAEDINSAARSVPPFSVSDLASIASAATSHIQTRSSAQTAPVANLEPPNSQPFPVTFADGSVQFLQPISVDPLPSSNCNCGIATVIANQEELKLQLRDLKKLMLKAIPSSGAPAASNFAVLPGIPLCSQEDLRSLEDWLGSPGNYQNLVSVLGKIGGYETAVATYSILQYLFQHEFALSVRLTSRSGKTQIQGTNLQKAIRDGVRVSHPNAKDKDIDTSIGAWFRRASDRNGGRKRRQTSADTETNHKTQVFASSEANHGGNAAEEPLDHSSD